MRVSETVCLQPLLKIWLLNGRVSVCLTAPLPALSAVISGYAWDMRARNLPRLFCPPKRFGEGWNRGFSFQLKGPARHTRSALSPHRPGRSIHGKAWRLSGADQRFIREHDIGSGTPAQTSFALPNDCKSFIAKCKCASRDHAA
jgi:hypothetical protein